MTNETKHTPTPWFIDEYKSVVDEKGQTISANGFSMVMSYGDNQKFARANAAHIVKCVNMHDELVEALTVSNTFLKAIANQLEIDDDTCIRVRVKKGEETVREIAKVTIKDAFSKSDATLAKARGEV